MASSWYVRLHLFESTVFQLTTLGSRLSSFLGKVPQDMRGTKIHGNIKPESKAIEIINEKLDMKHIHQLVLQKYADCGLIVSTAKYFEKNLGCPC